MRAVAQAVGGAFAAGRERCWVREAGRRRKRRPREWLIGRTRPDVWVAHPMATERGPPIGGDR
jgi:hypothetical protein